MAFAVGEASSASPSTSTPRSWSYHVFLSFSGEDTRTTFTAHLSASLKNKGIKTFRDDKDLERGEVISVELLKAIEESMFGITVLSPNYAFSTWCLDELQKIVECINNLGLEVVPVFYGVEPANVRYQRGSFAKAFGKHEKKFGQDSEKVKKWRDALGQVANYGGWHSKNWSEAALVESIAEHILKKLIPKLPPCTKNLVGIASRVEKLYSLVGMGLNDVRFIGIWGMGGIGKTTIARAVYEVIRGEFKVCCFLANVREASKTYGLVHLQRFLLSHLNISSGDFYDLYDGKQIMQNSLRNKKVLLVLDDVSEESHLENLAGKQDCFGPGSRVIITTRDRHLLTIQGVDGTYGVEGLVQKEALHLFCLKAFHKHEPREGYLDLSEEVVKYTGGLPLALKVLGSYLYGRNIDVWRSAVEKIISIPSDEIIKSLEISYESLDPMEKNIFLDIACFFKGMNKEKVIEILKNCGQHSRIEIEVLIERSLVTLEWRSNNLEMHDLLQEMGRNIVLQESPKDPGKRSRLWSQKDIDHVFIENKGTEAIQSIVLNVLRPYEAHWNTEAFSKTSQLKFLSLYDIQLPLGLNSLPSSLKVLHWRGCSLKTLPLTNQKYEFVDIKLCLSKIEQLWHGKMFLEKLKHMDLSFSKNLKQSPDFSGVLNLETLVLEGCTSLTEVHPSLVHHKKVGLVDLQDCKSLEALPGKLEMSSLKELNLTSCSKFKNLPEFGESMKHLSMLSLEGTTIRELPSSLGYLVGLEVLNLKNCKNLVCLPDTISGLKFLTDLNTCGCSKLGRLPCSVLGLHSLSILDLSYCNLSDELIQHDFCDLPSLKILDLSGNNFVRVPIYIRKLSKLEYLRLNCCRKLQCLPELPSRIRELDASDCDLLRTSEFDPYCLYASLGQYPPKVLDPFDMLITGSEIPPWFDHQEEGQYVSVPRNCPLDERVGIALCFLVVSFAEPPTQKKGFAETSEQQRLYIVECALPGRTGKTCIKERRYTQMKPELPHLYVLFLPDNRLDGGVHEDSRFGLFQEGSSSVSECRHLELRDICVMGCGARWVRKKDFSFSCCQHNHTFAGSLTMERASSSSPPPSATPGSRSFHVFLSFWGEDICEGFIDHLYASLERKGINTTPGSWSYHVFLSLRGEDTGKGFTHHVSTSLEREGITTLRDDKDLERGEVISLELLKAIEESMFAITILSPNYASSTWCLDELQKIVEYNNNNGLQVMPVFYGVDPSDVRRQRGNFKEAFTKHEERFGQDAEKVEKWRDALRQVASDCGWHLNCS